MYDRARTYRTTQRLLAPLSGEVPAATGLLALGRVRKLLMGYLPGMACNPSRLRTALAAPLSGPAFDAERLFALGWLRWLEGEDGEGAFAEAIALARALPAPAESKGALPPLAPVELLARAAYWRARAGLLRGRAEALTEFEAVLRSLGNSPQATAWFVDLLWRAGRTDRAEQVWKSVRGNRRVSGCDEGPLLEARALLRRGESAPAERALQEAVPAGGVAWVERRLLLAWALATLRQPERALAALAEAERGPYPVAGLAEWRRLLEGRTRGALLDGGATPLLRDYLRGQAARQADQGDEAAAAYRAALAGPVGQPFARAGLAALGQDDWATVLASQPGLFLAVRCRARIALERFRQRQIAPAELLDALHQAANYQSGASEHFRQLALALQQRHPDPAAVYDLPRQSEGPEQRNNLRAALELAVRRLPSGAALELLRQWAGADWVVEAGELRRVVARQLLCLALLERDAGALSEAERLFPDEPLAALAKGALLDEDVRPGVEAPAVALWQAARRLSRAPSGLEEDGRESVRQLRKELRLKPLAQALLLQEAAGRGDVAGVAALLEEVDAWRGFRAGPPAFVLRAVEATFNAQPNHPGWKRALPRWLQLWEAPALGPVGAALAAQVGLKANGEAFLAPVGVPVGPWLLHQAARALGRDDARLALSLVRRALALEGATDVDTVRAALPELEQRASAQALAACLAPEGKGGPGPDLLIDLVALLRELPDGAPLLEAAEQGDRDGARTCLAALVERPDLPPRLAHHLALLEQQCAEALEAQGRSGDATAHWRRAWRCWLAAAPSFAERGPLFDWLLAGHRRHVNALLARGEIEAARGHWNVVEEVAGRAELGERIVQFREELATEYLLSMREAMRYGSVPEGWRADYEKGLGNLGRLLALDRDNVRLLTALVEVCNEWFFDLYNAEDQLRLRAEVDRSAPFAERLARLVEDRPGDLAARAALSDFWKVRGFVCGERAGQVALYREALRFNPANGNVRDLLAELGEEAK